MLSRMLYVSTAVGPITTAVTGTILRSAQLHNTANGITGILCQGRDIYLQVLEGEHDHITALYKRIALDRRHTNLVVLQHESVACRRFGRWAMAHVEIAHLAGVCAEHPPTFNPYAATAEEVMGKMDVLVAAGKVMSTPVV